MVGFIYFILQNDSDKRGLCKIGWTGAESARARRSSLQTGNPFDLRVLGEFVGSPDDEGRVHERLGHLHVRGEWYALGQAWDVIPDRHPDVPIHTLVGEVLAAHKVDLLEDAHLAAGMA